MFHDPTFWVLVAFVIFVAAVSRPISRMAGSALDSRGDKIRDELDEAERLRTEAQDLLASYQRKQRDAAKEAEAIVAHAREEAERMTVRAAEELEVSLARRERLAIERIEQAEVRAVAEVRALAVDIAIDATRDMIEKTVQGDKASAMIDASIQDLSHRLN